MKLRSLLIAVVLVGMCSVSNCWALSELQYKAKARQMKAVSAISTEEVQAFRSAKPNVAIDMRGQVIGTLVYEEKHLLMIRLADDKSVEVNAASVPAEIQPGVRVSCLARAKEMGPLELEAIIIDVGKPPTLPQKGAVTTTTLESANRQLALTSRGDDSTLLTCKRAILHFNPRLPAQDVNLIANSIVSYSNYCGIDPYFVVAVVAAESRFNPNARSYKGAMGLGQLMPGTAKGMGVSDPYDPGENLAAAIKILSKNLSKYEGQPYQAALALAAYNAGSGAVKKYGGVPPYRETHDYIWKVYEHYCWMYGMAPEPRPK